MDKQIKERGIIFNGEMVRAILDGRKTQTRRVIKSPATTLQNNGTNCITYREAGDPWYKDYVFSMRNRSGVWNDYTLPQFLDLCPFGKVGDRLWVREAFQGPLIPEDEVCDFHGENPDKFYTPKYCEFAADGGPRPEYVDADDNNRHGWRPSIHMPRWASRIMLEITDIRVERLNDISEEDAKAEGAPTECCVIGDKHFLGFRSLWKSIYGQDSWQSNPWVWVVEFNRVEAA